MAISVYSCLQPSSSPPPPPPALPKTTTTTLSTWRRRCVSTLACVVIGSSTMSFSAEATGAVVGVVEAASEGRVVKWSDKRRCPPWHENSLETIVPENLPRPSVRSRSDGLASFQWAPSIKAVVRPGSSCYSL